MRRWPLLRNRDYMLLWSGQTLSELGSQTSTVAYPLLVLALTGSAAKAGVVGLAKWLPLALFALPAGALADGMDRKRLMITTDAIRLAGAASIVAALWLGRPPYLQVVLVAFLDGAMFVTSWVTEKGALGQVVPPAQVLWMYLADEHRADEVTSKTPADDKGLRSRMAKARRRPIVATTSLCGVIATVTAAVVLLVSVTAGTQPAYALTRNPDGSITVTINDLQTAIPELNARFAAMGVDETVVPITQSCQTPMAVPEYP